MLRRRNATTDAAAPHPGRARWAAIGAAIAVVLGAGGAITSLASTSPAPSVFVPMTPCRLLDTRAGATNVGPRSTPLGPGETWITPARGAVGSCSIPSAATALSLNVTIIDPSKPSYLTVFPGDVARPTAANLNWVADQDPTPNAVTAGLGADGSLAFFNLTGTVEISVDVVGHYLPADAQASDLSSDLVSMGNTISSLQTQVSTLAAPKEIVSTAISVPGGVTSQFSVQVANPTTTTAGRWSISTVWNLGVTCTSGTSYVAFLLVDDVIVPSTMVASNTATADRTAFIGTTVGSISAGTHTVKVGAWCVAGTVAAMTGVPNTGVTNVTVLR